LLPVLLAEMLVLIACLAETGRLLLFQGVSLLFLVVGDGTVFQSFLYSRFFSLFLILSNLSIGSILLVFEKSNPLAC
jgi:hypothetical protein